MGYFKFIARLRIASKPFLAAFAACRRLPGVWVALMYTNTKTQIYEYRYKKNTNISQNLSIGAELAQPSCVFFFFPPRSSHWSSKSKALSYWSRTNIFNNIDICWHNWYYTLWIHFETWFATLMLPVTTVLTDCWKLMFWLLLLLLLLIRLLMFATASKMVNVMPANIRGTSWRRRNWWNELWLCCFSSQ